VGHAINISGLSYTYLPNVGVLLFFILSGFVIAHTLSTKSDSDDYGIAAFGIERFARIYTAFLPAIILIAAADYFMQWIGHSLQGDPNDLRTLLGNITMRQGLPSRWGVSTFGSAGHLTSVALEFHIYFFVGAIFFLLKGRNVLICAVVAILFSKFPLGYVSGIPDSDRALFVMWLAGFAAYYVVKSIRLDEKQTLPAAAAFIGMTWYWASHRTPNDYDLSNYSALTLAFLALVIFTQGVRVLPERVTRAISFAARYSFSLFLVHFTIVKIVLLIPVSPLARIAVAILVANLLAVAFWYFFERHYQEVAAAIKRIVFRRTVTADSAT
jgi:peptidoglycan/LPS O-acetylase OafA/YrhL